MALPADRRTVSAPVTQGLDGATVHVAAEKVRDDMPNTMETTTLLEWIDTFVRQHRTGEEVDKWCRKLYALVETYNCEPDWGAFPLGTSYYRCRAIHMRRGE